MVIKKNNINTSSKVIKNAKGVSKGIVKHQLTVDDYRRCLTAREGVYTVNTRFVYKRHEVNTVKCNKLSQSAKNDKRYILPDEINLKISIMSLLHPQQPLCLKDHAF